MSNEENAHIKEVINYLIHAYPDLVTLARLHQSGFDPDPGSSPIFTTFVILSFLSPNYFFYLINF